MRALAALALALLPLPVWAPAWAQAYQCTPSGRITPPRPIVPDGPVRRTPIAGYTLAASWSPDYCKTSGDTASLQCSGRNGRFGFVLHGLWPESASGPGPQWCQSLQPSVPDLRANLCMTPSPDLLAHEWAKHGSCMARTPVQYFRAAAILWRSLHWPDVDRLSRKDGLTVRDLREAFVAENPAWRPDEVGVVLSRTGWLREMRLCYSRRFLPARCDRRRLGTPDAAPLKIWRGL
jgi:ribonuclease T2